ncbi:hypothetical protein [Chryseobacterium scophthalmum]|uniref:Uncharacterized protein n=1 Tax=Chryseobacterium scophthalmum TaxID=59733 RepID=A0A1N6E895_9FLAO|nr:hypothetical protein [Chryseobacterium scophthalmum]SIN79240.1 hypothetical protein SAMN05421769_0005 [Chryseobacterium scophthalmum]
MNDKHLYLALLKIKNNTNINELVHEGLELFEITNLLKQIIELNYLIETESELILSETGYKSFTILDTQYKKTNKSEWIRPDDKNIIKKIRKNDIFVPSSKELTFRLKKIIRK